MSFSPQEKQNAGQSNYHVNFYAPVTTSQIQQGSIESSQAIYTEVDFRELRNFTTELRKRIPELGLPDGEKQQLAAELGSVEAQLNAPQPKRTVIAECLSSVRNILEGCAGSLVASGLLQTLAALFPR
jgi:hypothetical protein